MRVSFLFRIIFFLLIPVCGYAQTSVVVKGQVIDALTKETVPYATIRISEKSLPDLVQKAVPTDNDGKFSFSMTKKGEYLMEIQFVGKLSTTKDFIIGNEKVLDLGMIEMKDDDRVLKEVVVTSQKPLVKVDLDKITYSMEDDPESKTSTALDMLRKVPMITVDGEDNIQLKGSASYKIYINGKPSTMVSSNPKDVLKSMPASTIKDIEVITDPGAKYDAEGLAGIINIITQKQTSMGGYTASVNSRVDTRGGYGAGGYLSLKVGKIGFTGNYNYYNFRSPKGTSRSFRDDFNEPNRKYLYQDGTSKYKGNGQYGSGELSYEIDTLNLINIGFNRYHGSGKNTTTGNTRMLDINNQTKYEYNRWSETDNTYGSTGINVDYQRTFSKVKDRLLTASYRYDYSPNDWSSENTIEKVLNFADDRNNQFSDGSMKEHTFQVDYTTPIAKIHTLETGVKYIIRLNESNSGYEFLDSDNNWVPRYSPNDKFKHEQDILSAYAGYNVKIKKFGFKTGLRYESTNLKAKYPLNHEQDFKTDYSNLVPSATVTYQLKPMQNIRLGYNMRISRPGIWQLNPFVNSTDTNYISVGNPNLDAVKSHAINLNYSLFNPKLSFNSSLTYSFVNNDIENITEVVDGVSKSTYQNIGENKKIALFTYLNWTPTSKLRITANLSGSYVDIKANDDRNLSNHGFEGRLHGGIQYTMPKSFRLNVYGGTSSPSINLQGKWPSFTYHSFSLSKSFMSDKLNTSLSVSNPFRNNATFRSSQSTDTYYYRAENIRSTRFVSFSVSFRFGEMKAQIKKAQRGINNDDSMGGNSGGGTSGQGGTQQAGS